VGAIGAPHGIAGEVRIRAFTEQPLALQDFSELSMSPNMEVVTITSLRQGQPHLIARIEGVAGRTEAEALRGRELLVPRAALPEPEDDEFYVVDLEGLSAVDASGRRVGTVTSVVNYGAGDLVMLDLDEPRKGVGKEVLIPFQRRLFPEVNLTDGLVTVRLEDWLEANQEDTADRTAETEAASK
jgi:16S rRNA processing protein RimM